MLLSGKRLTSNERTVYTLSPFQQEVLVGILLGDAWLVLRGENQNSRLGFAQDTMHLEFYENVLEIFRIFLTANYVSTIKSYVRSGYTTVTDSLTFLTMQLPCFLPFFAIFYVDGKKIVPYTIYQQLTAVGIAYWIICDGSKQNGGLHLNVYGFDPSSVDRLLAVLREKFSLQCTIHKHKAGPRIYIKKGSMPHLRSLVTPYMVPSMIYKISSLLLAKASIFA